MPRSEPGSGRRGTKPQGKGNSEFRRHKLLQVQKQENKGNVNIIFKKNTSARLEFIPMLSLATKNVVDCGWTSTIHPKRRQEKQVTRIDRAPNEQQPKGRDLLLRFVRLCLARFVLANTLHSHRTIIPKSPASF